MDNENYKIIVSISHHRISYEYWQRDGENRLVPMPAGTWPAPLAFYCSPMGVVVGNEAMNAVLSGTASAFGKYFELLSSLETYRTGGQNRPFKNLLLDASEKIFVDFYHRVLFQPQITINDIRGGMPLTIVCDADVTSHERAFLNDLFRSSGYTRVKVVDYNNYIDSYVRSDLSNRYTCDNVLVALAEGDDLTLTLFKVTSDGIYPQVVLPGMGKDPRKEFVKEGIWEDLIAQNDFLDRNEIDNLLTGAADNFLSSGIPDYYGEIMIEGERYIFSLNRHHIDHLINTGSDGLRQMLNSFLLQNGIENRGRTLLMLRGNASGNDYFMQNLRQGFCQTIRSDRQLRESVMSMVIKETQPLVAVFEPLVQPPLPPMPLTDSTTLVRLNKRKREVFAEVNAKLRRNQRDVALQMLKGLLAECENVSGSESIFNEVEERMSAIEVSDEVRKPCDRPDSIGLKQISMEFRQVRETALSCKIKAPDKAVSLLQEFIRKYNSKPGADSFIAKAENLIEGIKNTIGTMAKHQATNRPVTVRVDKQNVKKDVSEDRGPALIREWKIKEARDWYKSKGNNSIVTQLNKIIVDKRSADQRKNSFDSCVKEKDKKKIERIIAELEAFVALCENAGADASEYKTLIKNYKKIKV